MSQERTQPTIAGPCGRMTAEQLQTHQLELRVAQAQLAVQTAKENIAERRKELDAARQRQREAEAAQRERTRA
jgi:hypothetical protein